MNRIVLRVVATLLVLAVGGCNMAQGVADVFARDQARAVVNAEAQRRFPGVNVTPITDCAINNASAQELVTIATSPAAPDVIQSILSRPATIECITRNATGLV